MKKFAFLFLALAALGAASLACVFTPNVTTSAPTQSAPVLPTLPPVTGSSNRTVTAGLETQLVDLYNQVAPGVVFIRIYKDGSPEAEGSGFVYDKQGHIVTNYHVVAEADKIEVDFLDGAKVWAHVVGTDTDSDLAVLQAEDVAEADLHPLPLADSDKVLVGQIAVAFGNPFGLKGTMTVGVVSAIGRTLPSEHETAGGYFTSGDVIQTDAPINPGNSGGPLVNLKGEVIGINRAIRTTNITAFGEPSNSGIGFAVPSNIVRRVVPVLIKEGHYDYPYLGISSIDELTLADIEALGLPKRGGAYVISVVPGSPADKAGLRGAQDAGEGRSDVLPTGGDLIIAIDGYPVHEFNDLIHYLFAYTSPGDTVTITVWREGKQVDLQLTLGKRPR